MKINYISEEARVSTEATIEYGVRILGRTEVREKCKIKSFTSIKEDSTIHVNTTIGKYCSIGKKAEIGVPKHPINYLSSSQVQYYAEKKYPDYCESFNQVPFEIYEKTTIGNDVWIGSLAGIKTGLTIGDGAIVAMGAIVTKDVPPYAIVAGVPAKIIRYRFDEKTIERLLELQWWDLDYRLFKDIEFDNIDRAIEQLEVLKAEDCINA